MINDRIGRFGRILRQKDGGVIKARLILKPASRVVPDFQVEVQAVSIEKV